MCSREDCGTIFTGEGGVPLSVTPCREDYPDVLSYHQALWCHRDTVADHFNAEFAKTFGKAVRSAG